MKDLHNTHERLANDDKNRESSKKHDVNLQNNSSLYFQIGLILSLLATFGLFQMEFEKSTPYFAFIDPIDEPPVIFTIEPRPPAEEPVKERRPNRKVAVLSDIAPTIVDNNLKIDMPDIKMPDEVFPDKPTIPSTTNPETPEKKKPTEWNVNNVEKVPVFPGCESSINNAERLACMSDKLTKFIQKKFNTDLAQDLGLSGVQRIQVQFKIDATGQVTDIQTRSPHSELEKEAQRVVSKIPVMKPGVQNNTPVSVVYQLPIAFQIQ